MNNKCEKILECSGEANEIMNKITKGILEYENMIYLIFKG